MTKIMPLKDRFDLWVDRRSESECWNWTGNTNGRKGYGIIRVAKRNYLAHRFAYAFSQGGNWDGSGKVLHHCDNPPCCNPAHLYVGTLAQNTRDQLTRTGGAKLNMRLVRVIREFIRSGAGQRSVSRTFGISESHAWNIKARKVWGWVE